MNLVSMSLVLVCTVAVRSAEEMEDGNQQSLKMTLFYESLCPDCIDFDEHQVYNAWTSFKGQVLFDLLPFGNARQYYVDGHWKFNCQHGPQECLGNKIHACAIYQECGESGTSGCDVDKLGPVMDFIHCLLQKPDQERATKSCARKSGLLGRDILTCAHGDEGDTLLNFYGNRTLAFRPKIQYVPTVAINGKHDTAAENDLVGEICKLRPSLPHCQNRPSEQPVAAEVISV